jgi:hypothetical protein
MCMIIKISTPVLFLSLKKCSSSNINVSNIGIHYIQNAKKEARGAYSIQAFKYKRHSLA